MRGLRLRVVSDGWRRRAEQGDAGGRRPWSRLGLRARVTVTFGMGALALSATMAGLTYFTARQFILHERETAILRQAYVNASLARSSLRSPTQNIFQLLDSLDTLPGSLSVLEQRGQWYATSISVGKNAIPVRLRSLVLSGVPASQHFVLNGSPEMVVGLPVPSVDSAYFEVFSLDELARTLRILALALAGAALVTTAAGAVIGRWASGRALRPLEEVSKAAETIAGGRLRVRLVAADDPDLSALAASFNRMADALLERIEREARFTSDVSHELRSPLTTLTTSLGVLESHRDDLPVRSRRAVDLLTGEMRRFQRMVEELLEISRVDTGSAELLLDEVEVGELVRQAAHAAGAGDAPVDVDASISGLRLRVDKRRIERVVANLVENATLYAGGVARFVVEPAPGGVRMVVVDHGPAVALTERDRIFERFYRGQTSGRRGTTEGTGLGLSLVAEHVRLHGGRVWVENGAGDVNRFVVELPSSDPGQVAS
ncbi:MAG TPA: HAMP domain-containing sensor histidine kinase [Acidimicrobiales bacterium]|nr:HAMP domain-containing sensor histidine kinase [Acidimicrobiales bacterium]